MIRRTLFDPWECSFCGYKQEDPAVVIEHENMAKESSSGMRAAFAKQSF